MPSAQAHVAWIMTMFSYFIRGKLVKAYTAIVEDPNVMIRGIRASREEPKEAIQTRRGAALAQSVLVICPLAMTFGILQLSWRGVYWKDLDDSSSAQNSILTAIQFVAKFHEICIVGSLSNIVLHLIQAEMIDEGVPFGLMTSAYKVSSITYLWSWEFWGGIFERDLRESYTRRIRLFTSIVLISCLAAVSGPSSAITLLPRLDWWPVSNPPLVSSTNYIGNHSVYIWPQALTADHLPDLECLSKKGYDQQYCPGAGRSEFLAGSSWTWTLERNLTMPVSDSRMVRYLAASAPVSDKLTSGYTQASTISDITAKTLSCMWALVNAGWTAVLLKYVVHSNRPVIHASAVDGTPLLKPFVAVQCRSYNPLQENMEFPHGHATTGPTDDPKRSRWMVHEKAWNASRNASDQSTFSWFDLSDKIDPPSIAAILEVTLPPPKFPDPPSEPSGSHNRVVPCTVDAWWVPVRIWIDPKSDNSIHEDSADIVKTDIWSNPQKLVGAHKITINPSWADALNPKLSGSNETLIEKMITPQLTPLGPLPHVEDTVSYLLSLHIAEGLSRVSSETSSWHIPLRKLKTPPIVGPNATCAVIMCQNNRASCGPNVEENLATSGFKRITFNVTRYGYGWGLGGVAVKLANVALLLHALLCLGYATSTLWSGRTFSIAGSVGEAIALAVNSTPTEKLKNTCSGIRSLSTWKKVVVVRETRHDHVELVFEDGSDEELVGTKVVRGKRYGR